MRQQEALAVLVNHQNWLKDFGVKIKCQGIYVADISY